MWVIWLLTILLQGTATTSYTLTWTPNPPEEQVTYYSVLIDGAEVAKTVVPTLVGVVMVGEHTFAVAAVNDWGTSEYVVLRVRCGTPNSPSNFFIKPK